MHSLKNNSDLYEDTDFKILSFINALLLWKTTWILRDHFINEESVHWKTLPLFSSDPLDWNIFYKECCFRKKLFNIDRVKTNYIP